MTEDMKEENTPRWLDVRAMFERGDQIGALFAMLKGTDWWVEVNGKRVTEDEMRALAENGDLEPMTKQELDAMEEIMLKKRMIRIGDYILPSDELDRRLRTTHPCEKCGGPRYFSSRLRDDGLCCPCSRSEP